MALALNPAVLPTGGIIGVTFTTAPSGTITLERSPYPTLSYTTLYTGAPLNPRGDDQFFLDTGDQTPSILLPTSQYIYRLTDNTGTISSAPVMPVSSINIDYINWTPIFISILQGAFSIVQLPNGMKRPQVVQAMPLTGLLPMPFVVVTNELDQQEEVPVGQSVPVLGEGFVQPPYSNVWTQTGFDRNMYRVSIFSTSAVERDFYRQLVIATFRANLYYVFQQLGSDITHSYQAASYQTTQSHDGFVPGFYGCDIALEFTGTKNVTIYTSLGIIEKIDVFDFIKTWGDEVDQVVDIVVVPPGNP